MSDALSDRLREVLAHGPELRLAILFGSHARGVSRPDSDVDVAILPADEDLPQAEEDALAVALERATRAPVDLVRIDRVSPGLRWRIARDAVVLISMPPTEASRFLARTAIEHDELREIEADAMRRYRARLAEHVPGTSR